MRDITAGRNDAGQRIDKFLAKQFPSMPMSLMYKLIRKKQITVNRKRIKENYVLCEGDRILVFAPEDALEKKQKEDFSGLKKELSVVYEDKNILIANKKAGMLVHSDDSGDRNTLINQIRAYLFSKGEYDQKAENCFAPALCNRIDRNTEGLVIAAKNACSLRDMNLIIKERQLKKLYLAAVHGIPDKTEAVITLFLTKDEKTNTVEVSENPRKGAKSAVTKYRVIAASSDRRFSLLEIELITGRTHQIRATFAHIGHPLLGDGKYAVNKDDRALGYDSQALCAYSIEFSGCEKSETLGYLNGIAVKAPKPRFLSMF